MERSLDVMKEVAFQFDGDLEAKVFGVEIDAQSIVEDYKWMINKIERYEKALADIKNLSTLNEYADADINGLLDACYQVATEVKPTIL